MITANVLRRVFHFRHEEEPGTCFSIDVDGKQYLISADHLVNNLHGTGTVKIFHNGQWKSTDVRRVGYCEDGVDIAVLAPTILLTHPSLTLEPSMGNLIYGQDVFFLGFHLVTIIRGSPVGQWYFAR